MIRNAAIAGIRPAEFWEMSPFEVNAVVDAYIEKEKQHMEIVKSQSWLIAALGRTDKMPSYKEFMDKKEKPQEQTAEQMLNTVKMLHAALGGG